MSCSAKTILTSITSDINHKTIQLLININTIQMHNTDVKNHHPQDLLHTLAELFDESQGNEHRKLQKTINLPDFTLLGSYRAAVLHPIITLSHSLVLSESLQSLTSILNV